MSARLSQLSVSQSLVLNDVHSRLNHSHPIELVRPTSALDLSIAIRTYSENGLPVIASGGRHAMGGQQFCNGGVVLDCRSLDRVLDLDFDRGIVEVESGIQWPALVAQLQSTPWSIIQKQTGADRLTIGGAVAANIHGRGLAMRPLIQDIESLTIVDARGEFIECSRCENPSLFRHVVGGYGLFGVVYSVRLRLTQRQLLRRTVRLVRSDALMADFAQLIRDGAIYGDWQFAIDATSDDFLDVGILSAYTPARDRSRCPGDNRTLTNSDWQHLLLLAHTDKERAFAEYCEFYLSTDGQFYGSDTHQLSAYVDDYHAAIEHSTCARVCGSEMITELYVPRMHLADFLACSRAHLRACRADVVYGTVRLIERDEETALAWARDHWACIIFNLHIDHEPRSIARAEDAFRGLIDCALSFGGSYYLTYHRWATRNQALSAHPALPSMLASKRRFDPEETFQSDWYRHHSELLSLS